MGGGVEVMDERMDAGNGWRGWMEGEELRGGGDGWR